MRPIAVLSLLFLVNSFSLIFADDSEENSKAKIQIIDGSEENSQAPAVLLSSQPLTVGQAQENKNEILTNLQAMNNKLDRIEGTLISIQKVCSANNGKDSCDSENSAVIQAIRESQTTLEIRNYELQQLLEQCDVCKKKDETKTKVPDVVVDGCKPEADPEHLRDCCAIQRAGNNQSGLYTVYPFANDKTRGVKVYCDMETKGGGWTVIQRREETLGPTIGFQRNWNEYEAGFGNLDKTFWLGLPNIASLTEDNDQSLRYDMMSWNGESKFAEYSSFNVANVSDLYRMEVSGYDYSSTAGDSFSVNSGNQFSTEERDNDISGWNCAKVYKGAWWYRACHWANPNGVYFTTPGGKHPNEYAVGVDWYAFNYDLYTSLKRIDMKLRNRGYPNGCVKTC